MKLGTTRVDTDAATAGTWQDFQLVLPDRTEPIIGLKLASGDGRLNPEFKKALAAALEPLERRIVMYRRSTNVPPELTQQVEEITRRVFCEVLVKDWRGITDDDEQEVPYTVEGAMQLFEEFPELFDRAEVETLRRERFRAEIMEEASGN